MATGAVWRPYLPFLAQDFKLILPDARGHGRTSFQVGSIDIETMAQDCAAFLEAVGLERVFPCGWSMGVDVVLAVSLQFPNLVRGLICEGMTFRTTEVYSASLRSMGLDGPGQVNFERVRETVPDLVANWEHMHNQRKLLARATD